MSVELPKRRLTAFTGVSGSGKSSLVFSTIAAESQRMINETYSAFVQGFMPNLARPEVDLLEGLTTAIIVDQERMGANPRSTVGTATDANAMLRILFSRIGAPHIGPPTAFSFNVPTRIGERRDDDREGRQGSSGTSSARPSTWAACARRARAWARSATSTSPRSTTSRSRSPRARCSSRATAWTGGTAGSSAAPVSTWTSRSPVHQKELEKLLYGEPEKIKVEGVNLTYEGVLTKVQKSMLTKDVEAMQPTYAGSSSGRSPSRPAPTATARG